MFWIEFCIVSSDSNKVYGGQTARKGEPHRFGMVGGWLDELMRGLAASTGVDNDSVLVRVNVSAEKRSALDNPSNVTPSSRSQSVLTRTFL